MGCPPWWWAVFFDRDGTLMEEVHYCRDPATVHVFPGVREALAKLFEEANLEEQPVAVLLLLAKQLEKRSASAEYSRRVQAAHRVR